MFVQLIIFSLVIHNQRFDLCEHVSQSFERVQLFELLRRRIWCLFILGTTRAQRRIVYLIVNKNEGLLMIILFYVFGFIRDHRPSFSIKIYFKFLLVIDLDQAE